MMRRTNQIWGMACYSQLTSMSPFHHHFLMDSSASLFSLFPGIHPDFSEFPPSTTRWLQLTGMTHEEEQTLYTVLPQERCSQESHRTWWSSHHSESLPCTSQSRPACSDLLHPEGYCPVSNPCNMGQNHIVNASLIPIRSSWVGERGTSQGNLL